MKKIPLLLSVAALFTLSACTQSEQKSESTKNETAAESSVDEQTKESLSTIEDALTQKNYYQAEEQLTKYLQQHPDDTTAQNIQKQLTQFQKGKEAFNKENLAQAKTYFSKVETSSGSSVLKDQANQWLEKINKEQQSNVTSKKTSPQKSSTSPTIPIGSVSESEKEKINQQFYEWAIPRAKTAHMVVTDAYNVHGAVTADDIYMETPDGKVLVQSFTKTNEKDYVAEAIGGVVFMYSTNDSTGAFTPGETTATFFKNVNPNKIAHKYILASNGKVYELIAKAEDVIGMGGFVQAGYKMGATERWIVSKDAAAQAEWNQLIKEIQ